MAQDELLEAHPRSEPQSPGAEASDRSRGDLDDEDPGLVDSHLGVDRALRQAEGPRRGLRSSGTLRLNLRRQARRRDVDRLLEEGTVERVGLVEERKHAQLPSHEEAFESNLHPGDEILDEDFRGRVACAHRNGRILQDAAEPLPRTTNSDGSSARITPRLAERKVGLRTHGYLTPPAPTRGPSSLRKSRWRGDRTPASASRCRILALLPAAVTEATELCNKPSRPATAAATIAVRSSTPTTAATGVFDEKAATRSAHAARSAKSSLRSPEGLRRSIVLASSEATVTSSSSFDAAARKSDVR